MKKQNLVILFVTFTLLLHSFSIAQKKNEIRNSLFGILDVNGFWPISGTSSPSADQLNSPFGPRYYGSDNYDFHEGIDIEADFEHVHAFYHGTVVENISNNTDNNDNYVTLRHIDPGDGTVFYTGYHHLFWDSYLEFLEIGDPVSAGVPFVTSGSSGTSNPHLHFAGMVGGTDRQQNAINPMREDSLPFYNAVGPCIINEIVDLENDLIEFTVTTPANELDLNRIELKHFSDKVSIDFDNRVNTDAFGHNNSNGSTGNEDGIIEAKTEKNDYAITIQIITQNFTPPNDQSMTFRFTHLPFMWFIPSGIDVVVVDTALKGGEWECRFELPNPTGVGDDIAIDYAPEQVPQGSDVRVDVKIFDYYPKGDVSFEKCQIIGGTENSADILIAEEFSSQLISYYPSPELDWYMYRCILSVPDQLNLSGEHWLRSQADNNYIVALLKASANGGGVDYKNILIYSPIIPPGSALVTAKVYLQGPFRNSDIFQGLQGPNEMRTSLRDYGGLPLTAPYSDDPATVGYIPSGIVDWISVKILNQALTAVVGAKSVYLNKYGQLVDRNGTVGQISITIDNFIEGNSYYLVIFHRNHLSIMSAQPITLYSETANLYDFTVAQNRAYGLNPMREMVSGIFGMRSGDSSSDGGIDALDFVEWRTNNGKTWSYTKYCDFNLDGGIDAKDVNWHWRPNNGTGTSVPYSLVY